MSEFHYQLYCLLFSHSGRNARKVPLLFHESTRAKVILIAPFIYSNTLKFIWAYYLLFELWIVSHESVSWSQLCLSFALIGSMRLNNAPSGRSIPVTNANLDANDTMPPPKNKHVESRSFELKGLLMRKQVLKMLNRVCFTQRSPWK